MAEPIIKSASYGVGTNNLDVDVTGCAGVSMQLTGTWTGNVQFYASTNGIDFDPISGSDPNLLDGQIPVNALINRNYKYDVTGYQIFRAKAIIGSGTITISTIATASSGIITAIQAPIYILGGTIGVTSSVLPSGASTSALQGTTNSSLSSIDTKTPALGQALAAASTPVVLTAAQVSTLTPLASIGVNNFPATQAISAATLPLPTGAATETTLSALNTKIPSGLTVTANRLQVELPAGGTGLTNTELRASAVPVSLTSTTITGSVAVTGPLTDTQIRATALPVSGTVSANATLSAETTKVIGTVNIATAQSINATSQSLVSSANSSTAALGIGAVFTGTSEQVQDYATIQVNIFSDQASAALGLSVQQSSNGTNWDITDTYTIPASTGKIYSFVPAARFYRIVYTNGAVAQTAFRLQTIFHYNYSKGSTHSLAETITTQNDAELNISQIRGLNGTSMLPLLCDASGNLQTTIVNALPVPNSTVVTGSISALNGTVVFANTNAYQTVIADITGTFTASWYIQGTSNGTDWVYIYGIPSYNTAAGPAFATPLSAVQIPAAGFSQIRIIVLSYTSGTINVRLQGSAATSQAIRVFTDSNTILFTSANLKDGVGTSITSQSNGTQRAIDVGINVAGVQVDPRAIRALTSTDVVTINPPAITKGTQGTTGVTTQDLKDAGRVSKIYSATFSGLVTEALVTLTPIADGVAGVAATSFAITSGKRLRIQSISLSTRNAGAAGQGIVCQLRINPTGLAILTSPLIGTVAAGTGLAIANIAGFNQLEIPDGLELSGTMQFALTQVGTATANNTVVITGYEY